MKLIFGFLAITHASSHCRDSTISTCNECITKGPDCHWCHAPPTVLDLSQKRIRCGTRNELINDDCSPSEIGNRPDSEPLEPIEGRGYLKPRFGKYKASYGSTVEHKLEFTRPKNFDVDMFFVMDLSYSMNDDLSNLKNVSAQLTEEMRQVTEGSEFKIGFSSFVDRPLWPYVNPLNKENPCKSKGVECEPTFTYKTNAELTKDYSKFRDNLDTAEVSSNIDKPEDGLTAITQAIQCKETSWRESSFKILIFATDAPFKAAGDGLVAGLTKTNDGQCHMQKRGNKDSIYSEEANMDYPSVGRVLNVIKESEMSVILAVTKDYEIFYTNFKEMIQSVGKAELGFIAKDSSNLKELVIEQYKKLSEHISLKAENVPDDIDIEIIPNCGTGEPDENGVGCDKIKAEQQVGFTVKLTMPDEMDEAKCRELKKKLDDSITFKVYGMSGDNGVSIKIELECDCECDDSNPPNLSIPENLKLKFNTDTFECQNGGNYTCGVCSCPPEFSGLMCECESETLDTDQCKNPLTPNENKVCSGLGFCDCDGTCVCNYENGREIKGKYCEFDSNNCPRGENGETCSGHGECKSEGTNYYCECNDGWSGEDCGCEDSTSNCQTEDGKICHGNGKCVCNQCQCDAFANGYYTEEDNCKEMKTSCSEHEACARCIYETIHDSNSTVMTDDCSMACNSKNYHDIEDSGNGLMRLINPHKHEIEEIPNSYVKCKTQWPEGRKQFRKCILDFGVRSSREYDADEREKRINILVGLEAVCPEPPNLLVIFGSIFGTLLFLGILILLLIVLIKRYLWRKETKEHFIAANKLEFRGQNPLYKEPETSHTLETRQPLVSSSATVS